MNNMHLTWKDVFDGSKFLPGTYIGDAINIVWGANYKYLAWNGVVYFIHRGMSGFLEWDELPNISVESL